MPPQKRKLLESDLFKPVSDFFVHLGYEVHGEVNGCDITASKNDELIIVEMKLGLNLELLIQTTKRQRLTEYVYMAIPRSNNTIFTRRWNDFSHLVRRLELGLMTVSFHGAASKVDILIHPSPFDRKKSMQVTKKKTTKLMQEIGGRHGNYNTGGSTRKKIMTLYKENAIQIACFLKKHGQLSSKKLRALGTGKNTISILYKNYYGWFDRVDKGVYRLTDKGCDDLNTYPDLVSLYENNPVQIHSNSGG